MTRSGLAFLLTRVRRSLWFTPTLFAIGALAVLLAAPSVAPLLPDGLMDRIGLSGVYDLLTVLANTLLAVSTFSLAILVSSMQVVGTSATPRVRPLLAEDRTARRTLSTFVGGFVYAAVGLLGLSTSYFGDAAKVLLFFVTGLVLLALVVALIRWIGRLRSLGGITEAIDLVAAATRAALRGHATSPDLGGTPSGEAPIAGVPIGPDGPAFLQTVDVDELGALAERLGVQLHAIARPGTFVGPARPLAVADRPLGTGDRRALRRAFVVGERRSFEADPRFGLVVLSEIASRALSPAVNDPGTAIDVVTTATRLLAEWGRTSGEARPGIRHPRLHVAPLAVEDLLVDAFRAIGRDGAKLAEVHLWLQKGLLTLVAQDEALFGPAARAMSREALARAEQALDMAQDLEPLRALAARVERA